MAKAFTISISNNANPIVSKSVSVISTRSTSWKEGRILTYLWTFISPPILPMFSNWFLKSFRILLLPFAIVYWFVIALRNFFYNIKLFKSSSFGLPVICVGNLSVGGTGKSPMVEYLVQKLKTDFKVATVSRGYK